MAVRDPILDQKVPATGVLSMMIPTEYFIKEVSGYSSPVHVTPYWVALSISVLLSGKYWTTRFDILTVFEKIRDNPELQQLILGAQRLGTSPYEACQMIESWQP